MSTKTNFKRIAVVAVASLGLGVLTSVAPANAAVTRVSVGTLAGWTTPSAGAYAGVGTSTPTQIIGGTAVLTFAETITTAAVGDIISNITSTGVGSITAASGTNVDINPLGTGAASQTVTYPTTAVSVVIKASGGASAITSNALATATIRVSSMVAGTQTLTAAIVDANGTPTSTYTATVTWVATGAGVGVSAANSTVYVDGDGTCISGQTSKATDSSAAALDTKIRIAASSPSTTVCLIARDSSNNLVPLSSATVVSSLGSTGSSGSGTLSTGRYSYTLAGVTGVTGTAAITAILIDTYGNVASLSTALTYYGTLATLTLGNVTYAAAKGGGTNTNSTDAAALATADNSAYSPGYAASGLGLLSVVGKDAAGNVIDLATNDNSATTFTIDSDANAGSPVAGASDSAGATVAVSTSGAGIDIKSSVYGNNIAVVNCGSSIKTEKLTINIRGLTSTGVRVTSNPATFYCSGAVDKVTVTASGTSVNVNVTDANGYPVADGTSVALAASNGSVVAPSSKTTENGKFATAATFIANSTAATSSVTAIVGGKSGTSAAVAGSGTSIESQIASMLKLIQKIMKKMGIK
jgi:hypothetical protein